MWQAMSTCPADLHGMWCRGTHWFHKNIMGTKTNVVGCPKRCKRKAECDIGCSNFFRIPFP